MYEIDKLIDRLEKISGIDIKLSEDNSFIYAEKESIVKLMRILKEEFKFMMLTSITSVDYIDRLEVVYHLTAEGANLIKIKVVLDSDDMVIPSIISIWKAADVQEREVYDLMGIVFEGHDNLKRVLCRDDFEGHPLRKDFILNPVNRF